ncbi:MAG: hypothetical protein IJH41_01635 [Eubacterium sp.]|nr:hypothetical protein [Eubacterium sp.]
MENRFEITKEMLMRAKDYLTLNEKEGIANAVAPACIKRIWDFNFEEGRYLEEKDMLPGQVPMWGEDQAAKSAAFLGAVMYFYFGENIGENLTISHELYDLYAGSHVFNQIERFKADPATKNKAFDILSDIRDLEKRINCATYSLLQVKNDVAKRVLDTLQGLMASDALATVIEATKEAQEGIEEEKRKQDEFIASIDEQKGNEDG